MTFVILTRNGLQQLASGAASMNFAGSELFEVKNAEEDIRAIYCKEDAESDPLIAISVGDSSGFLPDALRRHREPAYHRMISFIQRSTTFPVALPRGWRQYKHDNLLAFFALPQSLGYSKRWIAEVNASGKSGTVFWDLTDSENQEDLASYQPRRNLYLSACDFWLSNRLSGLGALTGPAAPSSGIDVTLDVPQQLQSVTKSRTYSEWLPSLT